MFLASGCSRPSTAAKLHRLTNGYGSCRDEEVLVRGLLPVWEDFGHSCNAQPAVKRPGMDRLRGNQLGNVGLESYAGLPIL